MTGASTGMGAATARELARRGYRVLAGVRRESDADAIRAANIEPVILDITDAGQINTLNDHIAGPIAALINNAGIAVNAPVETLPLDEWRHQFEVNLFGHIAVTQALLPRLIRDHGRIVNISSIGGRVALPTYGAYAGTKFALEAVSDALRRELAPHGVPVIVVEPGGVKTEMVGRGSATANRIAAGMSREHAERWGVLVRASISHAEAFTEAGVSADRAAQIIAGAVTARRPRTRYAIGRDAAVMSRLSRVLPDRLLDRMLLADMRPHMR